MAIVGNGFDLNHGYKSDYKSFIENTVSPYLDKFKTYCDNENITTWYLFEESIRILTEELFFKSVTGGCNFDENRNEVQELADVFQEIHILLKNYLLNEIKSKKVTKKPCVEKYLNDNSIAINFNYSNTVEAYTKNVIYVHGSLEENDILLGYDYRDEACYAQYEDIRWSKSICRESLAFRRFLLKKKKYDVNNPKYKMLVDGLEKYHQLENTGKGLDDEVKIFIPEFQKVHAFLKKYRKSSVIPEICYSKIKTIAVLGHGIKADKKYLDEIISRCVNLTEVVIYRYRKESNESFNEKVSFFAPYCKNIKQVNY